MYKYLVGLFFLCNCALAANAHQGGHSAPPHVENHHNAQPHVQHSEPLRRQVENHHIENARPEHKFAHIAEHKEHEEWREHGCRWRNEVVHSVGFCRLYPKFCFDFELVLPFVVYIDDVCGHYEVVEGPVLVKAEWSEYVYVDGEWQTIVHPAQYQNRIYRVWVRD